MHRCGYLPQTRIKRINILNQRGQHYGHRGVYSEPALRQNHINFNNFTVP